MSMISEKVDPTTIQDEFDNLVTEMEQDKDQAFRLVPLSSASFPLTLRKVRRAARAKGHGVKVYSKVSTREDGTEDEKGSFTVATIGLEAPITRAPAQPKTDAKVDGIDPTAAAQTAKPSKPSA